MWILEDRMETRRFRVQGLDRDYKGIALGNVKGTERKWKPLCHLGSRGLSLN